MRKVITILVCVTLCLSVVCLAFGLSANVRYRDLVAMSNHLHSPTYPIYATYLLVHTLDIGFEAVSNLPEGTRDYRWSYFVNESGKSAQFSLETRKKIDNTFLWEAWVTWNVDANGTNVAISQFTNLCESAYNILQKSESGFLDFGRSRLSILFAMGTTCVAESCVAWWSPVGSVLDCAWYMLGLSQELGG